MNDGRMATKAADNHWIASLHGKTDEKSNMERTAAKSLLNNLGSDKISAGALKAAGINLNKEGIITSRANVDLEATGEEQKHRADTWPNVI